MFDHHHILWVDFSRREDAKGPASSGARGPDGHLGERGRRSRHHWETHHGDGGAQPMGPYSG